ncbi:hypothetical protein MASR2M117_14400 [Paludibacter sp.]
MKRILFFIASILIFASVSAQFNLGIKAGYNSSLTLGNLSSVTQGTYNLNNVKGEMWNNFQAGAFARVFIKKFYIQPEVLYSMQKKEYDLLDVMINGTAKNVNTYMNISTVQVPLFLGYKLLDLKVANLRAFAGPKFVLNSGSKLEYKNLTAGEVSGSDLVEDFKKSQVDIEVGAGIDVFMFALDAKLNVLQDVAGKFKSISDVKNAPMPTSTLVISLAWKLL